MDGLDFENHRRGFDFRFGLKFKLNFIVCSFYCLTKFVILIAVIWLLLLVVGKNLYLCVGEHIEYERV